VAVNPEGAHTASTTGHRVSAFFHRHPGIRLLLFLLPGLLWLGVLYLGSLGSLVVYSLWSLEDFTGLVVRTFTTSTYRELLEPANYEIVLRTAGMAAAVTIACGVLAFPFAYFLTRYASPRMKTFLYIAVIMPLWSSYLVRALAWRSILAGEGVLMWVLERLGLDGVVRAMLGVLAGGSLSAVMPGLRILIVFDVVFLVVGYVIFEFVLEE